MEITDRIGKYKILSILGKGSAGQVFHAVQDQVDRPVALKILFPNLVMTRPHFLERFFREARIIARLHHPNIIAIYEMGEEKLERDVVLHYYTMEFVEHAVTLHDIIRDPQHRRFTMDEKLDIAEQLTDALRLAHREGVVHRDLKPMNVLIDREGTPKILDFGVSKGYDDKDLTIAGTIIGSPPYMSPEQARGREVTVQSDVFSLGVMLYELFAGKRPFHATSKKEYIVDRQSYPKLPRHKLPARMTRIDPQIPREIDDIVFSMLEPIPDDRPTAQRLKQKLEDLNRGRFRARIEREMRKRGQIEKERVAWLNPLLASVVILLAGVLAMALGE